MNEEAVRTDSAQETLIPLDANHRTLCNIDLRETGFKVLCDILDAALEKARYRIMTRDSACKCGPRFHLIHTDLSRPTPGHLGQRLGIRGPRASVSTT